MLKDFRESGDILVRGSGNYASDEQKEIARLKRELRDAQDALDVLKKQSTFWENDGNHLSRSINTINKAKARRIIDQPLIIHSDRGSQYVAKEYKKATENMRAATRKKHFRFTKLKKCGTLEGDLQRNYKVEWSVTNWAF